MIKIDTLIKKVGENAAGIKIFFNDFSNGENSLSDYEDFANFYLQTILKIKDTLLSLEKDNNALHLYELKNTLNNDVFDYLNRLTDFCQKQSFSELFNALFLDFFTSRDLFSDTVLEKEEEMTFYLSHADRICRINGELITDFLQIYEKQFPEDILCRVKPQVKTLLSKSSLFNIAGKFTEKIIELKEKASLNDPFRESRSFRFVGDNFFPTKLKNIRQLDKFYGYDSLKKVFNRTYDNFIAGKENVPLLISSFPGLGKTQLTIASALIKKDLTLILAEPEELERPLELLLKKLSRRKNRRFIVFFDDIDPNKINWYYFRTNIGGYFSLPENVAIVIASNYQFPPNISSRGNAVTFPMFDDVLAMTMVSDYLKSKGMRTPSQNLIAVITSDYLEKYGQRYFQELSPRTLVRYLTAFDQDPEKRRRTLDISYGKVIPIPEAEVFHEFNVKMMKNLYGEEAVIEWRNRYLNDQDIIPYIAGKKE